MYSSISKSGPLPSVVGFPVLQKYSRPDVVSLPHMIRLRSFLEGEQFGMHDVACELRVFDHSGKWRSYSTSILAVVWVIGIASIYLDRGVEHFLAGLMSHSENYSIMVAEMRSDELLDIQWKSTESWCGMCIW
jgi:hypothetical protein